MIIHKNDLNITLLVYYWTVFISIFNLKMFLKNNLTIPIIINSLDTDGI